MYTKDELKEKSVLDLRKVASDVGVRNYGKMDKMTLITSILETNTLPPTEYTDKHFTPIKKGDPVKARLGGRWYPGTISKFSTIGEDQYVYVLLEDSEKPKMFHSVDIDASSQEKSSVPKIVRTTTLPLKKDTITQTSKKTILPLTEDQLSKISEDIEKFLKKEISKKQLVVGWMDFGITKQQIDKFVDPSIIGWSYVYTIYREHGK